MFSSNDRISLRQLQILIILILFSANSLTLPHVVTEYMGQTGWMLVITGCLLLGLYTYIIVALARVFPDESLVVYSNKILFNPLGYLVVLVFFGSFLFHAAIELRLFGELVKQTLLKDTPLEVIILAMLFVVVYLNRKGIECRARIGEIIIFVTLIPIGIILLLALGKVEISNLNPIIEVDFKSLIKGSYHVSLFFSGMSVVLFSFPVINQKKDMFKGLVHCIIFVGILGIILSIVTIGVFGHEETARQLWPVMTIMQVVEFPGAFIERQDALMMSFWILTVFVVINAFVYYSALIISQTFKMKENDYINVLLIPVIYVCALIPDNVSETTEVYNQFIDYVNIATLFIIPLVLLGIAYIRKLGHFKERKIEERGEDR